MGISTKNVEPEDDSKWISVTEAAEMLQLNRDYFTKAAKAQGYTRRQAHHNAQTLYLRTEIETWAELTADAAVQWLAKYPGAGKREERWTEKIDLETARRLFISTKRSRRPCSASRRNHRQRPGANVGRLVCYQTAPGHPGSASVWFSRRAVRQLAEDPERLKKRETLLQKVSGRNAGGESQRDRSSRSR